MTFLNQPLVASLGAVVVLVATAVALPGIEAIGDLGGHERMECPFSLAEVLDENFLPDRKSGQAWDLSLLTLG